LGRKSPYIVTIALIWFLFIKLVMNQVILAKPWAVIFPLLVSLGLGFLLTRTGKKIKILRMAAGIGIACAATLYCGFAYLTTSSWYFELAVAVSLLVPLRHLIKNDSGSVAVLLVWIVSMWFLQGPRLELTNVSIFIAYLGLVGWVVVIWRYKQVRKIVILEIILAIMVITIPIKEWKFLALTEDEKIAILDQDKVEAVFWDNGFGYLPRSRMEMLCNQETGKLVITPHTNSTKAAMIAKDGKISSIELGGEAPDKSISIGPYLVSAVSQKIILIDLATKKVKELAELGPHSDVFYMNYNPENSVVTLSQLKPRKCLFYKWRNDKKALVPMEYSVTGKQCVAIDSNTALVRRYNNKGIVILYDFLKNEIEMATSADMRGKKYPLNLLDIDVDDQSIFGKWVPSLSPFNQLRVDFQRRKFYIPSMYRGKIFIYDLDSLEYISSFDAHVGVRNVLIDKNNPNRVFSWNYATGEVIEHQLPDGNQLRSWNLGPILRTLNWDCNQQDLLATTAVGGFRIHLN